MKPGALLVTTLAFVLSACGNYDQIKDTGDDTNLSLSAPDFKGVRAAILEPRCITCHQQYGSYASVRRELSAIQVAVATDRMPKQGGALSNGQKRLLNAWVSAGAPERAGEIRPPPAPLPLAPTWTSLSEGVIVPRCLICHNPRGQARFLDLSTRQMIFNARDRLFGVAPKKRLLNFEDPDASYLLEVLRDPEEPMPPPASKIPRLNTEEIETLKIWIGLGLP